MRLERTPRAIKAQRSKEVKENKKKGLDVAPIDEDAADAAADAAERQQEELHTSNAQNAGLPGRRVWSLYNTFRDAR